MQGQPHTPGIYCEDSLAEAGCKVLRFHFEKMVEQESGTIRGHQIEPLHQMRVAVRKMRVALSLFGDHLHPDQKKRIRKGLRHLGATLGEVRDLDIFWEKSALHYNASVPDSYQEFCQVEDEWAAARNQHQRKMAAYLAGPKYKKFKKKFLQFLKPPFQPENPVVPVSRFAVQKIATALKSVQSFRPVLQSPTLDDLHALRIALKKLRYTIEFFVDLMGEDIQTCLKQLKQVQDHIGDLNDARVAIDLLNTCVKLSENRFYSRLLAEKQTELTWLIASFAETWGEFDRPAFVKNLVASYPTE